MIKAVVFDFDGLIVDTETPWFTAYGELFKELGGHLPLEQWEKVIGTNFDQFNPFLYLEQQINKKVDREQIELQARTKYIALMDTLTVRPGVESYLQAARTLGLRVGLASSSSQEWVESYLVKYGLREYFEIIRTRDDVHRVKPDPELYISAIEHLGVSATEAVAFEDSLNGLRAAKAAGLYCVIVPNAVTRQLPFDTHDLKLDSMQDMTLEEVLKRIHFIVSINYKK